MLLPASDPAWRCLYPPNGHDCRCRVDSVTVKQANYLLSVLKRIKLAVPGRIEEHVSPGFDAPPSSRAEDLQRFLDKKLRELSAA